MPTSIFGQKAGWIQHASDLARIQVVKFSLRLLSATNFQLSLQATSSSFPNVNEIIYMDVFILIRNKLQLWVYHGKSYLESRTFRCKCVDFFAFC